MENMEITIADGKMLISIDIADMDSAKLSSTGKTRIVATTDNLQTIELPGRDKSWLKLLLLTKV